MQIASPVIGPAGAAKILGVTPTRVVQLANEGRLPAIKTPIGRLFEVEDVERLARERAKSKVPA